MVALALEALEGCPDNARKLQSEPAGLESALVDALDTLNGVTDERHEFMEQ